MPYSIGEIHISERKLIQSLTVKIHVHRSPGFSLRYWLGLQLMKTGVWMTGMACEVDTSDLDTIPLPE